MMSWHTRVAVCALLVLTCMAVVSQQDNKKVTVTLVRWPYT